MSSETAFLALRLEGPLQSWGFDSQYNRRNTGLMPTKSAIAGMCCAALGYSRGSDKERTFLIRFRAAKMTAIAIPRDIQGRKIPVRRLQDYHTVMNTKTANGGTKNCHITHRCYLADASFGIVLEGDRGLLEEAANALSDPVWGIWLGRKACLPTAPVCAGLADDESNALHLLKIGNLPLEKFTRQVEVGDFIDGQDSLADNPVSFDSGSREFSPRRVITKHAATE